jgi:pimeloyl-[acyl-carrier protein] methyl ester esterase
MIGFISIASFNCFYKHIPQQILSTMKRNMAKDTVKQLREFWHHAGLDHPDGFNDLNPAKLIEALGWLSKWNAEIPPNLPLKVLAAHDDQIVPSTMSQDIWGNKNINWIEEGGHMLPLTQSKWCTKHIKSFIDDLK